MKERVQKLMAQANFGSRRACEELIRQGRVSVNGVVIELGAKADPKTDEIIVDGAKLTIPDQPGLYIALNKPMNVLSTNVRHRGDDRRTVREILPFDEHLFSIGRLDAESEGLMVFTNDGDLTNRLTHPRYGHTKTYRVEVYGIPTAETLQKWESGVFLEEGKTAPCSVKILHIDKQNTALQVVMTEGKKRQIRRVASLLGHPVRRLIRTHIGKLELGKLRPGEWRKLDDRDIKAMLMPADEMKQIGRKSPEKPKTSRHTSPRKGGKIQRPGSGHKSGQFNKGKRTRR
jgi:23S rRNA pseudouridine2605 synthase